MKPKNLSDAEQMWNLLVESKNQPVEETTHRDDKKDALGPGEYVCPKTGNIMDKDGKVVHKSDKKKVEEAKKHEDEDHEDKDEEKGKYDDGDGKKERCDFVPCDEETKPDYLDLDGDDNKKESMKKAAKDKEHGKKHDCAKKVQHEKFGLGECVHGEHGEPVNGHVNWYTVVFEHGTEVVDTEDLIVLASESHEH